MCLSLNDLEREATKPELMHSIHFSEKFQCVYLELPKCGCSSIKSLIQTYEHVEPDCDQLLEIPDVHNKRVNQYALPGYEHGGVAGLTGDQLIRVLTDPSISRFSVVRNPYARLASAFKDKIFKNKVQKIQVVDALFPSLKSLCKEEKLAVEVSFADFVEFVTSHQNHKKMNPHWRPQVSVLFYDYINYDFIGKLEDAERTWQQIYNKIYSSRMQFIPMGRRNSSGRREIAVNNIYTHYLAERVYEFYKRDFEAFDYCKSSYMH
tara:strand:- start:10640 stop:11431 length:792 start_codon:yes stop_codon:yes gene_type:complete